MARLAYENFRNWDVDDVSTWLGEIHLSNHIPSFERNGITGARLAELSEKEIREQLRVVKPSELMALKGAIGNLVKRATPRKISSNPRSLTTSRERTGSLEKRLVSPSMSNRTHTLPHSLVRASNSASTMEPLIHQPQLKVGSAQELLDDKCRFSGWIRKQGGGHKNWKRRYLILRIGCLYYFANETASTPKGKFVLSGYDASICREADILKKYKHVLKLTPMNPHVRTYFIAFGSKGELERWKTELDAEIGQLSQSFSRETELPSPTTMMPYGEEDEYEEDDTGENIYDHPDGDMSDEHDYTPVTIGEGIYDKPEEFEDSEDHYSRVEEQIPPGGRPVVPIRSVVSLQPEPANLPKIQKLSAPPSLAPEPADLENPYLPILESMSIVEAVMSDAGKHPSSPVREVQPQSNASKPPMPEENDYVDASDEDDGSGYDSDDDGGGYYIMFRKPDELMPQSCLFDRLDRAEADKLLRTKNRDGTYLIREGAHAGAEKVLSVWHIDRCRHYKLFKDDDSHYSLTQGQRFRTLPELLQYYTLQSHLPRSDFYLGDPYHPDDH